jgi:glycosyltransferase involved in cell wall biosynthesis
MSKISVCMATYNGEKHIEVQAKSILDQLSADDELIISDDESIDKTISILESFNDKRIKIFKNTNSKGPVGNFENALSKANGDLIFLADQDDKWFENKIRTHIELHGKYDLVISDAIVVNEFDEMVYNSFFEERGSRKGLLSNLIKNSYIGCCMSFNRKILNFALPFPPYIHMHDWWIGLIAELKGKTFFCSDKLMYYVRHQNNASPTLGNSGYSKLKRIKNRFQLIYGLFFAKD